MVLCDSVCVYVWEDILGERHNNYLFTVESYKYYYFIGVPNTYASNITVSLSPCLQTSSCPDN